MSPFEHHRAWHVPGPLDVKAMGAAARLIEGVHDFAAFQAAGSSVTTTEREIFASQVIAGLKPCATHAETESGAGLQPCDPLIVYEVSGSGFLRHMVRTIVGSLVEVGRGRRPIDWMSAILASRDRAAAGPTAPPHGLFLVNVTYAGALAAGS